MKQETDVHYHIVGWAAGVPHSMARYENRADALEDSVRMVSDLYSPTQVAASRLYTKLMEFWVREFNEDSPVAMLDPELRPPVNPMVFMCDGECADYLIPELN